MQSNCVLWVEGPSDRIYLTHWIREAASDLTEGIEYSIMFYGGRLLRHLSADDPEVNDFISLRRLNRNLVVLMDSDQKKPRQRLNPTKVRVRKEFDQGLGFAWVTKGREIENYVDPDVLRVAVERIKEGFGSKVGSGQFDHAVPVVKSRTGKARPVDKIKVAHAVAKERADLSRLDLRKQIGRLVDFIRECNK
jgi:hypothetical protein